MECPKGLVAMDHVSCEQCDPGFQPDDETGSCVECGAGVSTRKMLQISPIGSPGLWFCLPGEFPLFEGFPSIQFKQTLGFLLVLKLA